FSLTLADVNGREAVLPISAVVRLYPANSLSLFDKIGIYLSRWTEYLTAEPREANTEGGVFPAIVGTRAIANLAFGGRRLQSLPV
ncbi:MAG: hypothetical protein MJA32_07110, partial [Proteobacteria bacterium]|nr:hypothetical protein [Pseudomonadota bacterium]